MSRSKSLVAAFALVTSLSACSSTPDGPLQQTTKAATALCGCTTVACAAPHLRALKDIAVGQSAQSDSLSRNDKAALLAQQLRAADCDDKLRRTGDRSK